MTFKSRMITESQNGWGWTGPWGVIWLNTPTKQDHIKPVARDDVQIAFEYLQGWRLHNLFGQTVPVLDHPDSKIVFPNVQMDHPVFQFVPIVSGPITGHHWKKPGPILFAPLFQMFIDIKKITLSLLFSGSQSFLKGQMLQSLNEFSGSLLDSFQYVHVSAVLGSPELYIATPYVASPVLSRGEGSPPLTCWQYFV